MKRVWFLLCAFGISVVHADVLSVNKFSGLNTDDSPLTLQNGQTPDSENVVTDDGIGLQGRKGFVIFSTEPASALWEFPLSDGTRYLIGNYNGFLKATTADGIFDTFISTVPADRTVAAAVLGDKFFFADTLNGLKYWNGTSVTVASTSLTVDKLVTFKGRLAATGKAAATRVIYLSKYLDGTSWTAPTNASDDDAAIITVSGALDENIQALYATFQDKLMWFKTNSFGAIYGSRRSNFIQRTFSDQIGVSSVETIQDCDGKLRWLGSNRRVWEFDGASFYKISEDVDTLFGTITQGDSASRSNTQTSQTHWDSGSQSPSSPYNFASTTEIVGSLTPKTSTFHDTLGSDFSQGSVADYISTSAVSGSLAPTSFSVSPTSNDDFLLGTFNNTQVLNGSVVISTNNLNPKTGDDGFGNGWTPETVGRLTDQNGPISTQSCGSVVPKTPFNYFVTQTSPASDGGADYTVGVHLIDGNTSEILLSSSYSYVANSCTWTARTLTGSTTHARRYSKLQINTTIDGNVLTSTGFIYNGLSITFYTKSDRSSGGTFEKYTFLDEFTNGRSTITFGTWTSPAYNTNMGTSTVQLSSVNTTVNHIQLGNTLETSATGSSWLPLSTHTQVNLVGDQYVRYISSFAYTGSSSVATSLNSFTIVALGSGTFTSRTFDTGIVSPPPVWGLLNVSSTVIGSGAALAFYTQSSTDGNSWDSRVSITTGTQITSARQRYLRYQVSLAPNGATDYATIDDVIFTAKSTGVFTTETVNVGSLVTAWGPVTVNGDTGGGDYTIAFGTSSDGMNFTFTNIANTAAPTVSTAPYAAIRITFDLDVATDTPRIDDITVTWTEGSSVRAASIFFNQRYWLAAAIGASTNNRVLVYDKGHQWQRYSGINIDAVTLYRSGLYFGNTSGVFQGETGYNDNGTSISSYYNTPTFAPSGPDTYSKYLYLYSTTDNSDSVLSTSYDIDGVESLYSLGSSTMNVAAGIQTIKVPFSVDEIQSGRLIDWKWGVAGTTFWRILNGLLYYTKDSIPF